MLRRVINLVVVGLLGLTIAALVALGPRPFERVLPEPAFVLVERVVGPNGLIGQGGHVARDAKPADFLADGPEGLTATGPIAASAGNVPVFIKDVLLGHLTDVAAAVPAEITTIRPILGCRPTPPQAGSRIGHVTADNANLPLALVTYDDADLAVGIAAFVERYRSRGILAPQPGDAHAFQAHDVVVTETSAPVYLVLENGGGNRIWNIHLAEGARVERVVLLGGAQSGVANLDPVIPVEVILKDGLADCGILPAYAPNAGQQLRQPVASTDTASQADAVLDAEDWAALAAAYDIWFRDSFGVLAGESRVGFGGAMVSLIGPVPGAADAKVVYAPISGAEIRTTQNRYFEITGQVAEGEDFAARVTTLATAFAFGDLANLRQGIGF